MSKLNTLDQMAKALQRQADMVASWEAAQELAKRVKTFSWLRLVERDGLPVIQARCPRCEQWADLDNDQLIGQVSTHHDPADGGCDFHETVDWTSFDDYQRMMVERQK